MAVEIRALSNEQLKQMAPSIFAEQAHAKVSDKYTFIPTTTVLESLRSEGWLPVKALQSRVNGDGPKGFQKHAITLRRDNKALNLGDAVIQALLVNSHDRSSAYQLHAGIFVLACTNGLMVADGTFGRISIRHMGNSTEDVLSASHQIITEAPRLGEIVREMKGVELNEKRQLEFAGKALELKWEAGKAPIQPYQLLTAHRYADNKTDLWNTFNRIQENLIRGGLRGRTATNHRTKTREIVSIGQNVNLNKELWTLAESYVA